MCLAGHVRPTSVSPRSALYNTGNLPLRRSVLPIPIFLNTESNHCVVYLPSHSWKIPQHPHANPQRISNKCRLPPHPSPPPSSHLHTPSVLVLGLASSPRSCAYGDVHGNRDGRRKVWYESLTQRRAPFAEAHALRIEDSRYRRRDRV